MKLALALLFPVLGSAALSVNITGATPTQAIMQISGANAPCAIALSTSNGGFYLPLHPDVSSVEYIGSNVDVTRPDTIVSANGLYRTVTLGHQTDDRALAFGTTYYYRVSGCGTTTTGSFTTPNPSNGNTHVEQQPWNSSKYGNLALPAIDWTNPNATYVDPLTGATLKAFGLAPITWRTGGGSSFGSSWITFGHYAGAASGWTNVSNIKATGPPTAPSAYATISGSTTPIDLYFDQFPNQGAFNLTTVLNDVGLVLWGGATPANVGTDDAKLQACIILNPNNGCVSATIDIAVGNNIGSEAAILSGSYSPTCASSLSFPCDPDGPWPSGFPSNAFAGWGSNGVPLIRMDDQTVGSGTLSVAVNKLTLTGATPALNNRFPTSIAAGSKIVVAGAGAACLTELCTVQTVDAWNQVHLVETPVVQGSNVPYNAYGWGIRLWKKTANGNINVTAAIKMAGAIPTDKNPDGQYCSTVPFQSGDVPPKTGYLCQVFNIGVGELLAFQADDGTVRILGPPLINNSYMGFDPVNAKVFYQAKFDFGTNDINIEKYTYTGDGTETFDSKYSCNNVGQCPNSTLQSAKVTDNFPVTSTEFNAYIVAHYPEFTCGGSCVGSPGSSLYGNFFRSAIGGVGNYFCMQLIYGGVVAQNGPAWIACADISPAGIAAGAPVSKIIHTVDGYGLTPNARFCGLHSAQPTQIWDTLLISCDPLQVGSGPEGGPWTAQVKDVQLSTGAWAGSSTLGWPNGSDGLLHTCPTTGLYGSLYNNCVTFVVQQNGPCYTGGAANYFSTNYPCADGISGHTYYPQIQIGDIGTHVCPGGNCNLVDNEMFVVLATSNITYMGQPALQVTAARNGIYDYCGYSNGGTVPWQSLPGSDPWAIQGTAQLMHTSPWTMTFGVSPGRYLGCSQVALLVNLDTGDTREMGRSVSGHGDTSLTLAGNVTYINDGLTVHDLPFSTLGKYPYPAANWIRQNTGFLDPSNFISAGIGSWTQGYPHSNQLNNSSNNIGWALDFAPLGDGEKNDEDLATPDGSGGGLYTGLTTTNVPGTNIWKINVYGTVTPIMGGGSSTLAESLYKTQPLIAWAGEYNLKEISGAGTATTFANTKYSVCYTLIAGECTAGSNAGEVYVNVPMLYNPGWCTSGVDWVNGPCVLVGTSGNTLRQFSVDRVDDAGYYSKILTYGFASQGRIYSFPSAVVSRDGTSGFLYGSSLVDGYSKVGFSYPIPPNFLSSSPTNQMQYIHVKVPSGLAYAKVEYGYSRYTGPAGNPAKFNCTARQDTCSTAWATAIGTEVPSFSNETQGTNGFTSGGTIDVPVLANNIVYYQVMRSSNGTSWTNATDVQAAAIP